MVSHPYLTNTEYTTSTFCSRFAKQRHISYTEMEDVSLMHIIAFNDTAALAVLVG